MRKLLSNENGITIIEMLLVVLLLSLLAGMAIPQMQKVATRQAFVSEVDAAIDDFRIAQSWARNSILEQQPGQSIVAYQIVKEATGYSRRQRFGDDTYKVLSNVNLTNQNIAIETWPSVPTYGEGFEFKVPSGRTATLDGESVLDGPLTVVFRHTRLDETISVTIDPSGTISR